MCDCSSWRCTNIVVVFSEDYSGDKLAQNLTVSKSQEIWQILIYRKFNLLLYYKSNILIYILIFFVAVVRFLHMARSLSYNIPFPLFWARDGFS